MPTEALRLRLSFSALGKVCILDIDVQGVKAIKGCADLDPKYVFVKPPSLEELEKRLRDRNTETEESLAKVKPIQRKNGMSV